MSETGLWGGLGDLQYSLACDRGWRGVAPSVAVFQCSFFFFFFFALGTSVREVNAALYVMCERLRKSEGGGRGVKRELRTHPEQRARGDRPI